VASTPKAVEANDELMTGSGQNQAEKTAKEKYYVPKLIKELFWNLKVAQSDINDEGINHNFLKAEEKRT